MTTAGSLLNPLITCTIPHSFFLTFTFFLLLIHFSPSSSFHSSLIHAHIYHPSIHPSILFNHSLFHRFSFPYWPSLLTCFLSLTKPPAAPGYGDSRYGLIGYMCLDSSANSLDDTFKLAFDDLTNHRVSLCVSVFGCVCVWAVICIVRSTSHGVCEE